MLYLQADRRRRLLSDRERYQQSILIETINLRVRAVCSEAYILADNAAERATVMRCFNYNK